MKNIATVQEPPYYAVIFTSRRTAGDLGYEKMAERMVKMVAEQPGFLGFESARDDSGSGITVSYWTSLDAIRHWKENLEHQKAQKLGRETWYESFKVRIAKVEQEDGV